MFLVSADILKSSLPGVLSSTLSVGRVASATLIFVDHASCFKTSCYIYTTTLSPNMVEIYNLYNNSRGIKIRADLPRAKLKQSGN